MGEPRRDAFLGFRHQWKHGQLVFSLDPTLDAHTPHLLVRAREPQLREGNAHLHGPTERVHDGSRLPHRIPRVVLVLAVLANQDVRLDAFRVDDELEGRAMVVVAVEEQPELITVRGGVPAREAPDDPLWLRVEQAGGHVQGVAVIH